MAAIIAKASLDEVMEAVVATRGEMYGSLE